MTARTLPLFPLPLVLFPGATLPLHVFEPRYRRLLADVLEGDRTFGLVFCESPADERALPDGWVGCEAVVAEVERLEDGRSNVLVTGGERFSLHGYVATDAPYLVARVRTVDDDDEPDALVAPLAARLREVFARVAAAARRLADDADEVPALPGDASALSYAIAGLVDLDAATRQGILANRSAAARLRELEAVLADAVESLESRAEAHRVARTNGRAGHHAH